ncbi:MAG: hypothetical protein RIS61_80 [Actinomycetota bacterium]
MKFGAIFVGLFGSGGLVLVSRAVGKRRIPLHEAVKPYLGIPGEKLKNNHKFVSHLHRYLVSGKSAPWASDQRVVQELRKSATDQSLLSFRFEQIIFAVGATTLIIIWLFLRIVGGHSINPLFGLILILLSFVGGGGFRSWLLKEVSRKRISNIESQLPAVLDLLAFAVAAGEPMITAMQRVADTCTGDLSLEIKRLSTGLSVGDNFLTSLDRIQKELDSQSVSRSFRAIVMAIERGTPIADVLRAQAMDSRNLEARKLMALAGKKETLMMIPVVFLILPMIVIVALYPGLMALQTF